ncbi:hypothetical protein [Desulfosarcina widdelii]|uniref:hypothetical protein n=1 Tax=Desulfosarcina widdelii TaxID=947919 RepID=UPI0012D36D94|nr:hypothetical protein [Desulfosarcina widdelii]
MQPWGTIAECCFFYAAAKIDEFVKSRNSHFFVIPAQAGIQSFQWFLDTGSSPA